jgi:Spy/CpxP family protein refolding chaperone
VVHRVAAQSRTQPESRPGEKLPGAPGTTARNIKEKNMRRELYTALAGVAAIVVAGIAAIAALPLLLPTLAQANPGTRGSRGTAALVRLLEDHAAQLKLDEPSLEQIRSLAQNDRQVSQPLAAQLKQERTAMRNLLAQPVPDETQVLNEATAISGLQAQLQAQRLQTLIAVRRLLTPDQFAAVSQLQEEQRQHRWGHHRHSNSRLLAQDPSSNPDLPAGDATPSSPPSTPPLQP